MNSFTGRGKIDYSLLFLIFVFHLYRFIFCFFKMSNRKGIKLRQWTQEDMERALEAVRERNVSATKAAIDFNVPRKTLTDRLHKKVADSCKLGKPRALSDEHEKSLCGYIEYMAQRGFPLTVNQIIMYAWCMDKMSGRKVFGEAGPCYGWWLNFKARYPDTVRLRKPESLDRGRAVCSTIENLRHYFSLLKQVLDEGDFLSRPQDIYNCDESIVDLNKCTQRVVIPRRLKSSHSRQVASTEHVSIHCCVSASGNSMPPFIIFKESFPGMFLQTT